MLTSSQPEGKAREWWEDKGQCGEPWKMKAVAHWITPVKMDQESKDGAEEKESKCEEHGGREQQGITEGFVQGQELLQNPIKRGNSWERIFIT